MTLKKELPKTKKKNSCDENNIDKRVLADLINFEKFKIPR